jgi:membrane protein YdbS with pleckstrin-like domain
MPEYRITIGSRTGGQEHPRRPPSKLEILKAALLGILGLAILIGIVIAAFVVGSIIASVLLILLAAVFVVWAVRRLFRKVKNRL